MNPAFLESFSLFLVLFNPFLMSIYLLELIRELSFPVFFRVVARASLISFLVFVAFAIGGEAIFAKVLQVRFAAFLLFGGVVFILIALQYMFKGSTAVLQLRGGEPERIVGAVAMPFMIGPGTISASVLTGSRMGPVESALCIAASLAVAIGLLLLFKRMHDYVKRRQEPLVERYVEVTGRVSALVIGAIAVEMILQGLERWQG